MQIGLASALALLIIGVVAWPLLVAARRRSARPAAPPPAEFHSDERRLALESVYEAIRTLQTDHALGRIAEPDFQKQLAEYRQEAAIILKDIDNAGQEQPT